MVEADVCPDPPYRKPPSTAIWGSSLGSECVFTHSLFVSAKAINNYSQSATTFDLKSGTLLDKDSKPSAFEGETPSTGLCKGSLTHPPLGWNCHDFLHIWFHFLLKYKQKPAGVFFVFFFKERFMRIKTK